METIKKVRVNNPWGVPNQYVVSVNSEGTYFQSYNSVIVAITPNGTFLDESKWDYSITTRKYRNKFLNETIKETRAKIKSGEYKMADLN